VPQVLQRLPDTIFVEKKLLKAHVSILAIIAGQVGCKS
jgi:hypothetical protein